MRHEIGDAMVAKLAGAVSATSGAGSVAFSISDAIGAVFGVPMAVLLAAVAGAFGALMWLPPSGSAARAVTASAICAGCAAWTAPLAGYAVGIPAQFNAGVALVIAAVAQIACPLLFVNGARYLNDILQRLIARIGGGGSNG